MLPPLFLDVQPHHRVSYRSFTIRVKSSYELGDRYVRCTGVKGLFECLQSVVYQALMWLLDSSTPGSFTCSRHRDSNINTIWIAHCK